jgi:hypothetical protein
MTTKSGDSPPVEFPMSAALGISGAAGSHEEQNGNGNAADLNTLAVQVRDEIAGVSDLADRIENAVGALEAAGGQITAAVGQGGKEFRKGMTKMDNKDAPDKYDELLRRARWETISL